MDINKIEAGKSLLEIQRNYILSIGKAISGIKALILDTDAIKLFSLFFSQSEAHDCEFFLIESIDCANEERLDFVTAIYIIKCSKDVVNKLFDEISCPRFKEYHIFFLTDVESPIVRRISELDKHIKVHTVSRLYLFYQSLSLEAFVPVVNDASSCRSEIDFEEEAILSVFGGLRKIPSICYYRQSSECQHIAGRLSKRFSSLATAFSCEIEENQSLLLIVDRNEDIATPLLIHWNYLWLINEVLECSIDRVCINGEEYNMSLVYDTFYKENIFSNYGELAFNLRNKFEELTEKKKGTSKIQNFEEMQRILMQVPELKKEASNISKHFTLLDEITRRINDRKLVSQSSLEQEIMTRDKPLELYKAILDVLKIPNLNGKDKFRLVALFCLRFNDTAPELLKMLKQELFQSTNTTKYQNAIKFIESLGIKETRSANLLAPFTDKAFQLYNEIFNVSLEEHS